MPFGSYSKILKWTALSLAVLVTLSALAALIGLQSLKPAIETAASNASGMVIRVAGRLSMGFYPDLRITLNDLIVRNGDKTILSAREVEIRIELSALLRKQARISEVRILDPELIVEKNPDGSYNFETRGKSAGDAPGFQLQHLSLTGGSLHYTDHPATGGFRAEGCDLKLDNLQQTASSESLPARRSFSVAEIGCQKFLLQNYPAVSELRFSLRNDKGVHVLDPLTLGVMGGAGSGRARVDLTGDIPRYELKLSVKHLRSEDLLRSKSGEKIAEGPLDLTADLSFHGKNAESITQSLSGPLSLRGRDLILHGTDIDQSLARLESSQNFSLLDTGAFFLAGPLGVAVTKGYDFAGISRVSGGSTIRQLVAEWTLERGIARARDVAMTTPQNRLALTGKLDLRNERFEQITLALLDAKGCAKLRQRISGPFKQPTIEKTDEVKALAGPVVSLFKKAAGVLPGKPCEVFYAGSVTAPNP